MEENNKFETNTEGAGGGSLLYGAGPQLQAEENGNENGSSSVYGTAPVQLTKPSEPETQEPASVQPVQLTKPSETAASEPASVQPVQLTKPTEEAASEPASVQPVQLTKPSETAVSEPASVQPVQLTKPSESAPQPQQMPGGQAAPMGFGNGQPYFGPIQPPPTVQGAPAAKPKKKKTGIVVGILCAAAVVIVIAAGILLTKSLMGGDPKKQLAKGAANMAAEMAAYQSSVAEDIGLVEFRELQKTKPVHMNVDLSFTDPNVSGRFNNISVGLDGITDYKGRMAEYDVSIGTYGIDMNIGTVVAAENRMYLSVPILFDEVYSLDLTNFGRDFNKSAWADFLGETIPEDYSMTLFEDAEAGGAQSAGLSELSEIYERQLSMIADALDLAAIKQKREFSFGGTVAEYGGVRVTMDKDAFNEFQETMKDEFLASAYYESIMKSYQMTYAGDFDEFKEDMDNLIEMFFGGRFEQDIVIDYYLDKKGRIVNISTPEDIAVSSLYSDIESIAVDIDFSGEERTLDSIEGGVYMQSGDEILYMGLSRSAYITEDYYSEDLTLRLQEGSSDDEITFWYANDWGYADHTFDLQMSLEAPDTGIEFSASGGFSDIVKGEGYTFRVDSGTLRVDDEDLLLMSGVFETEVTDDHVEVPENAIDILEMSETDIMSLLYGTLY